MQRFCPRGAIPFHQLSWWLGLSAVNCRNIYITALYVFLQFLNQFAGKKPCGVYIFHLVFLLD